MNEIWPAIVSFFQKVITYKYSVNDNNGNHHSKHETISGNIVSGEYRVLLPNGRTQVVTYKADKDKFQPTIKYLVPKPDTGVKLPDEGMGNKVIYILLIIYEQINALI